MMFYVFLTWQSGKQTVDLISDSMDPLPDT